MSDPIELAQVYRFHSRVALWIKGLDTAGCPVTDKRNVSALTYLSPREAMELSNILAQYAIDCCDEQFANSALGTKRITR